MWKTLLEALWQAVKIVGSMCMAIWFMRLAVRFGATPLEAGFAAVTAAVILAASFVSQVLGVVGDSFHPKVDALVSDVGDLRSRSE